MKVDARINMGSTIWNTKTSAIQNHSRSFLRVLGIFIFMVTGSSLTNEAFVAYLFGDQPDWCFGCIGGLTDWCLLGFTVVWMTTRLFTMNSIIIYYYYYFFLLFFQIGVIVYSCYNNNT